MNCPHKDSPCYRFCPTNHCKTKAENDMGLYNTPMVFPKEVAETLLENHLQELRNKGIFIGKFDNKEQPKMNNDQLFSAIMQIPCLPPEEKFPKYSLAWVGYKEGHKAARHAAAEIVMATLQDVQQAQAAAPEQARDVMKRAIGDIAKHDIGAACDIATAAKDAFAAPSGEQPQWGKCQLYKVGAAPSAQIADARAALAQQAATCHPGALQAGEVATEKAAAANAAGLDPASMVADLVHLWDASVSEDDYNDALCAIEDRMRAFVGGNRAAATSTARLIPLADGLPLPDDHLRVLVYTDGVDFNGDQYFDISTEDLWEPDPGLRTEVADAATHWMPLPIPDRAAAPAQAVDDAREIYTCIGKGGEYELLGRAAGAGPLKGNWVMVYRDSATGDLYFRHIQDFEKRMERAAISSVRAISGKERDISTDRQFRSLLRAYVDTTSDGHGEAAARTALINHINTFFKGHL